MKRCPDCQTEIPSDGPKCPKCGLSLDETLSGETAVLPSNDDEKSQSIHSTESADGAKFAAGTMLAGRYRIVTLLGRGGMGEVYKAEDLSLKQIVALKFLPETLAKDDAALARFQNEVRITRQISHPNVCRVYDIGEADGRHFLSMELSGNWSENGCKCSNTKTYVSTPTRWSSRGQSVDGRWTGPDGRQEFR